MVTASESLVIRVWARRPAFGRLLSVVAQTGCLILASSLAAQNTSGQENQLEQPVPVIESLGEVITDATQASNKEANQELAKAVGLEHIALVEDPALPGLVSAECSPDGRHLYTAAFTVDTVGVFDCDIKSGQIGHQQSIIDDAALNGAICLRLSPSGGYAVATSIFTPTVALFKRDDLEGRLELLHVGKQFAGPPLLWPTDAAFSPDGRFVYVIDSRGEAVVAFRVKEGATLEWVETDIGRDGCFGDARGIAMHPDGRTIFIASSRAGTLAVLDRDTQTGHVEVRELIDDGGAEVRILDGVMGICCSRDGRFVYSCSGRFRGSNTIATFRVERDRKLSVLQAFVNDAGILRDFRGGNEITVSPDGLNVYACGTLSGSIACFRRDPGTGKLTYLGTLQDETTGAGFQLGACALGCSPNGQFLYVALENRGAVSVFRRHTK